LRATAGATASPTPKQQHSWAPLAASS